VVDLAGKKSPVALSVSREDSDTLSVSRLYSVGVPILAGKDGPREIPSKKKDGILQKQLDPDALWISAIFLFSFPPEVLSTYVAEFLLLLETLRIESHVKGLNYVTSISSLLALDPNLQEELLSGFLPSWLNLIFSQDCRTRSF
jgi:hypothetical protein